MDPDKTLTELRELVASWWENEDAGDVDGTDLLNDISERFIALDAWLSNGGARPKAWQAERWIIRARVTGGMTGTREAICKKDGEIMIFTDRAEAEAEAKRLSNMPRQSPALFEYWVEPEPWGRPR